MLQKSREMVYAAIAMVIITLGYLLVQVVYQEVPAASSFWGHSIGVLGFILMLMTETLYSLRKRSRKARWGKMSRWLEFHIFTGVVGPFMVLLHPGWQFKGLAGILSLLTILIVISGFIGRYIYTAIPRTSDGVELALDELEARLSIIDNRLANLAYQQITRPQAAAVRAATGLLENSLTPVLTEGLSVPLPVYQNSGRSKNYYQERARLVKEQQKIRKQIFRRQTSRKLFSLWHTIHIPLGLTLFLIAFIHTGAAIYYALLLR